MNPSDSTSDPAGASPTHFSSEWNSLKQYRCPEWFRDAKFGIWSHWGPQAVPEGGDWYARNMYVQGHAAYELHLKKFGHPSKVGYKDVVPLWKAEQFDAGLADHLMRLYKAAGARYFVSMGVHHDNFDLWNSRHHKWNAVQMGPHKDIVGIWAHAAREHGLRFGVSEHLERAYNWFNTNKGTDKEGPLAGVPYDGNDPQFSDFYFPPHEDTNQSYPVDPPEWWARQWSARIKDLLDHYEPDLLYTDGGIPFGEIGREVVAHLYNSTISRYGRMEGVYTLKEMENHGDYVPGIGVLDMERGVLPKIEELPWQTDTSIGDWFYNPEWNYRPVRWTIHMLVDVVSKNGNLLLNVVQRPDGTIDPEAGQMLREMAAWMQIHGEAIHGTRPWLIYGEGDTPVAGGHFQEDFDFTATDIRFTTKGDTLYAIALGWPSDGLLRVKSLSSRAGKITDLQVLGFDGEADWHQSADALEVRLPTTPISPHSVAIRLRSPALNPAG